MHRDTVTRSWGPLSCNLSAVITSYFSTIMHGPMLQGSVHNSWKVKMSQFFHGLHTHQTCHPLSKFGMLWIDVYNSVFQFPPISNNFAQTLKRQHSTGHNQHPDQLYVKEMFRAAWGKWWSHQILTGFTIHAPTLKKKKNVGICDQQMHICQSCAIRRLGPNNVFSIDWFPYLWNCCIYIFV